MEYKYYIYVQLPGNTNKYNVSNYQVIRPVTPSGEWDIQTERQSDYQYVFRRKFSGSITLSGGDYDAVKAYENTDSQLAIVIEAKCSGQLFTEFWKGFFSKYDWDVDEDRCLITFTPTVWDKYSAIIDQIDIERNVLECDPYDVYMTRWAYPIERKIYNYNAVYTTVPKPPLWQEDFHIQQPNYYYLTKRALWYEGGTFCHITDEYVREYQLTDDGVNPPGGDPSWVLDPLLSPAGNYSPGVYKWVRPFGNSLYQVYTDETSGELTVWTLLGVIGGFGNSIKWVGCRKVADVLNYFAGFADLTLQSSFFQDDPHPMGGKTFKDLMMQQISDVRIDEGGEGATKTLLKLSRFLTDLNDTFDVHWYVDDSDNFIVEHTEYFDNNFSYTPPAVSSVTIDFTILWPLYVKNMRKYTFKKPELFRYEIWKMENSLTIDWTEGTIEYQTNSITGDGTKQRDLSFMTELQYLYDIRDELPSKGWLLLDTEYDGADYWVVIATGVMSNNLYHNARLSTSNLITEFWNNQRLQRTGYVNGVLTTFNTIKKFKVGKEFSFPLCCDTFNEAGIYRTHIGDGMFDEGKFESKSGNMTLTLIYE